MLFDGENMKQILTMVFKGLMNSDAKDVRVYAIDILQQFIAIPSFQRAIEEYVDSLCTLSVSFSLFLSLSLSHFFHPSVRYRHFTAVYCHPILSEGY